MERMPLSGRILKSLQDRYTKNRIEWGIETRRSFSEPVLAPLKSKGIIKGFPAAYDVARNRYGSHAPGRLIMGSVEFFIIAAGIKLYPIDFDGQWAQ